jgi:hypothetical protein
MVRPPRHRALLLSLLLLIFGAAAGAVVTLAADLDGDGWVDAQDEALLLSRWGGVDGDALYDPRADLDADGAIEVSDLAILGAAAGATNGALDTVPPQIRISLNDIPEDENDLLVAPPGGFRVTLSFSDGESLIDTGSLMVMSSETVGKTQPGIDLSPGFQVTPQRAVWEVPASTELQRTSHYLTAEIRDLAGNRASATYGFAVRDFGFGPPLGNLQVVFLNFDRNGDGGQAFKSSLRQFGLASAASPALEQQVADALQVDIVGRVLGMYGRNPDGTPGPDPVNILFTWFDPQTSHTSLCIGGEHPTTPMALGAAPLDLDNIDEAQNECAVAQHGVFPHAIDNLWGSDPLFQQIFWPLLPARGGVPIGAHALDAVVLAPGFDPAAASAAELARHALIQDALDAFAQTVAVGAAHEVGHTLGLSAPGPAPAGLFGGTSGASLQHDVTASGGWPDENFIMNFGGAFSFAEITGRQGFPKPYFRPIAWAYLTNRIVRNEQVTSLQPPPQLLEVTPNPVSYGGAWTKWITIHGEDIGNAQIVDLMGAGPLPVPVLNWTAVDNWTINGQIHRLFATPGVYTVRVTNDDQQSAELPGGLTVQP